MLAIVLAVALSFMPNIMARTTVNPPAISDSQGIADSQGIGSSQGIGPCATEDSDNCYRLFGGSDGIGLSFVTINGTTYYLHG